MANCNEERKNKSTFNPANYHSSVSAVRFAHRGKPQQQIYRPGSGPLKKTNGSEDNRDIVISHIIDMEEKPHRSMNYGRKSRAKDENVCSDNVSLSDVDANKRKKPGQALYVAKQKNFSTDTINKCHLENRRNVQGDNTLCNSRVDNNNSAKYTDNKNKTKRYSNRHHSNSSNVYNHNRDIRHSSEPRSLPHTDRFHEVKSLENLEKNYNDDKIKQKSHNKGNGSNYLNLDNKCRDKTRTLLNLPPRLQKKFLMENGYPLDSLSPDKLNLYANKKNHRSMDNEIKPVVENCNNLNGNDRISPNVRNPSWCQTLPLVRGRGRGIVRKPNKLPSNIDSMKFDRRVPQIEPNTHVSPAYDCRSYERNEFHRLGQSDDMGSLNSIDSEIYYNIAYNNESMQHSTYSGN